MAQTGYTPILIYSSSTVSQAPSAGNLTNSTLGSELAINITDGKLFYKDNTNAVQVIAWKTTPTTAGGTGLTSYTAGDLLYYATGTTLTKLAIGSAYQALQVNAGGTAPSWQASATSTLTAQGDLLYASAANTLARLAKNTSATRYLSNTGSSNNPAWAQIDLTNGVTGTLPVGNGGTGNTTGAATAVKSNATTGLMEIVGPGAGTTRVMTIPNANFTAARTDAANSFTGDQTLSTGNLIQGTAAKGVNFTANTPAAGMTSQLLNWYEEGTWTPVVAGASTAGTYQLAGNSASYVRIGRQVTLICYVQLAAVVTGGGAGALTITGVPFAKAGANYAIGTVLFSGVDYTAGANLCCSFGSVSGSSTIYFEETNDNAASSAVQIGGVAANDYIFFSITYWA